MIGDDTASTLRLVLAHGFTQTARSWAVLERLITDRLPEARTVAVDLPGHGDARCPADLDLWGSARHLVDIGRSGSYVGYSMGGRVALHAALVAPEHVERLILIGATAGIDDPDERRARRVADEQLARRIETIGVPAFVDEWLTNPLFAGLDETTALRSDRLRNTSAGLAASLRSTGTGTQTPLWDRLAEIRCPALVLAGERDIKFTELGARLVEGLPHGELVVIPGAGHSVHLEQPDATATAIVSWIRTHPTTDLR